MKQPVDWRVLILKIAFRLIEIGRHKFSSGESLFTADRGKSFRCDTPTQIKGFDTNTSLVVTSIDVENLRIQPFVDDSQDFNDYNTGSFLISKGNRSYLSIIFHFRNSL